MKCDKNKILISRYLDGKLSSREEARLLIHFESCPECKEYFVQLKTLAQLMPDLAENAPAELKDNVLNKIKALEPSEKAETRRVHFPYFTAAAAACVMIFALIGGHLLNSPISGSDNADRAEGTSMAKQSMERSYANQDSATSPEITKSSGVTKSNDTALGINTVNEDGGANEPQIASNPVMKPQIEVSVDVGAESFEQQQVDEGHLPWRLDVIQTTITFVSLKIYPEGVTGEFPISEKDITITEQTDKVAIVEIGGDATPIKRVYLQRLVRQNNTGIWSVVGYDPVEK